MDWLDKMNGALAYIEENLTEEIDLSKVAAKACCSAYNFQRMFSFIADCPLAEYIRRRRLTQAALELQYTDSKVIDVAVKYGYDSPVSFSRAFAALHGVSPSEGRQAGARLKAYPKISFQISIKGEKEMDYRIETKEGFDIFGIETVASLSGEEGYLSPTGLWQKCQANGDYDKLEARAGELPDFFPKDLCKVHATENYRKTEGNTFPYMIFTFLTKGSKPEGYRTVHIPAQTYVILPSERFKWAETPVIVNAMHKRFYNEWLPVANFERADGPSFEMYGGDNDEGYIELWFPVVRK
jgi:AraC family transcriptional regulator